MKKCTTLILMAALMSLMLVACSSESKSVVGTWEVSQDGMTSGFTFNQDGSGSASFAQEGSDTVNAPITYKIDGDKLTVTGDSGDLVFTHVVDGKKLTLTTDGESMVYEKK